MSPNPAGSGGAPAAKDGGDASYAQAAASNTPGYFPTQGQSGASATAAAKKKKHRGGKKRRNRRQSFAATPDLGTGDMSDERPSMGDSRGSSGFYRHHGNLSSTSLESEALLDHRDHPTIRTRRPSVPVASVFQPRPSQPFANSPGRLNPPNAVYGRSKLSHTPDVSYDERQEDNADDRTPLMGTSQRDNRTVSSYGGMGAPSSSGRQRRFSKTSASSGEQHRPELFTQHHHSQTNLDEYDINNPPSVPTSPAFEASKGLDDVMLTEDLDRSSPEPSRPSNKSRDALIDIDEPSPGMNMGSPTTPGGGFRRRMTTSAIGDVCFPHENMSEMGGDDDLHVPATGEPTTRRRRRQWPNLDILDAWSRQEKEQRTVEGMRMRKVSEPLMVNGRLRPRRQVWHREMSDAPFRFTYFNENFENTIHSQNISELVQPGQTFRNLFIPDAPLLEESSDDDSEDEDLTRFGTNSQSRTTTRSTSKLGDKSSSGERTRSTTPRPPQEKSSQEKSQEKPQEKSQERLCRYGPRPAWWLDVLSPTESEMTVIQKTFGLHPLTTEDILMQEQREKVELFKHYYFINYRTFEQDENSEDYLEPVNLYVVVFREGVISFHFSMTPHPANVRRRIRQLSDYLVLSPDWISYAIIDDITDAYQPMIQGIEDEVDEIDEAILRLHSIDEDQEVEDEKAEDQSKKGRDMLRRVGECRKKVMSLYRLLGNKADVIKGFAKRCNEQWDIAPRNEIGMYLGDIQDHIVTMTANLSHYEK